MRADGHRAATLLASALAIALIVGGCEAASPAEPLASDGTTPNVDATAPSASGRPDWYGFEMTDVRSGERFTINDFAGKVVLIETMAQWCPNCRSQEDEVVRLHESLGDPDDLVSISLDVDLHEDEASLKRYAADLGYDWPFAVAPLEVARALGNEYSAQFLNPPLAPMLLIDRDGRAFGLPYGLKSAEALQRTVEPLLAAGPSPSGD
jgi:thiol-disulfide isomerase/thioredoxin